MQIQPKKPKYIRKPTKRSLQSKIAVRSPKTIFSDDPHPIISGSHLQLHIVNEKVLNNYSGGKDLRTNLNTKLCLRWKPSS